MKAEYEQWIKENTNAKSTAGNRLSDLRRVEKSYGDIDEHYNRDELRSVIASLRYSMEDKRNNKPNTSKIEPINGSVYDCLASYRLAVEWYCKFRQETLETDIPNDLDSNNETLIEHRLLLGLERDMQNALRSSIQQLETGLEIIDGGAERIVPSGRIDITAKDKNGAIVAIELKTGSVRRSDIGQILSYMGDLGEEDPETNVRGILVASDFDNKIQAAARMVPNLSLHSYRVNFEFKKI